MSNLQTLIGYQTTDKNLLSIEKELATTEEKKKYAQARKFLKNAQTALEGYENKALALTGELARLEAHYKKVAEKLKEFAEIEYSELEENEGEIAYLKKNAQALADTLKSLKKDLTAIKEKIEGVMQEYKALKKQTILMQKQFKEYKEKYTAVVQSKEEQMQAIRNQLEGMEKDIPAAILERYKNKRKEGLWPVLCVLKGDRCGMCSMDLPRAAISELTEKGVIECENCHRLIYKE
ncbi:MAG: hypothetical protein IJY26_01210 [Clostridia bacterium]|nr:hypothetical protein [Clostridia bacterium]